MNKSVNMQIREEEKAAGIIHLAMFYPWKK